MIPLQAQQIGLTEIVKDYCSLTENMKSLVSELNEELCEHKIYLAAHVDSSLNRCMIRESAFEYGFRKLILAAAKHEPPFSEMNICIKKNRDGYAVCEILDTGPGIESLPIKRLKSIISSYFLGELFVDAGPNFSFIFPVHDPLRA